MWNLLEAIFIFYLIVNVIFCGWLASEKNRSGLTWVILSVFFGFLATAFLMAAPVVQESVAMQPVAQPSAETNEPA